jgi:hypothetical protein
MVQMATASSLQDCEVSWGARQDEGLNVTFYQLSH